jgi:hypothetical protein
MKKDRFFVLGMLAVLLTFGAVLAACGGGKKNSDGGSSSGDSGGGAVSVPKTSGRETPASDFAYDLSEDGNGIMITNYTGKGGKVVIPAKIEDMPVVEIDEGAFRGSTREPGNRNAITSIVVPASVVVINDAAFAEIDELVSVTLPDGIKRIPGYCFTSCKKLTTVNLPASLEAIDRSAFVDCGELNNLVIPASLTGVQFTNWRKLDNDNDAFVGCGKLPIKTRQTIQGWGYTSGYTSVF